MEELTDRWSQINAAFEAAIDLPDDERPAFLDRAEERFRQALEIYRAFLGAEHRLPALAAVALGETHQARGDHRPAVELFRPDLGTARGYGNLRRRRRSRITGAQPCAPTLASLQSRIMELHQLALSFGELEIRLDPWQVDYGAEILAEPPGSKLEEGVTVDVEVDGAWQPIVPGPGPPPERLILVDGVRRVEARLVVRQLQGIAHGVFASWAVGSVELGAGRAEFGPARARRVLLLGSGHLAPAAVEVAPGLVFEPASTAEMDAKAPAEEVQARMLEDEAELVRQLSAGDALVLADGPLRLEQPAPGREGQALGYVKRISRLYLSASYLGVLARLPAGGRTPLFGLLRGGFSRFAWYLRLAAPLRGETDLSGLVRLEVAQSAGLDTARQLADATCRFLPPLAPRRWQDPRAPQNLTPIAALERQLTRLLGDGPWVRRQIETYMAREAA